MQEERSHQNLERDRLLKAEKSIQDHQQRQVVGVIGAGLSGLSSADELIKQFQSDPWCEELEIVIIEALDRVGGKSHTIDIEGTPFDLGAQFIGDYQKHTLHLVSRSGCTLCPQSNKGSKLISLQHQTSTYHSNIPNNLSILSLIEFQSILTKIDRMSSQIPSDNPTNCPSALYWDSITTQEWINQNIYTKKIKLMIESASRILFGCELAEVSFLYYLWFVKQNGGFENLVNVENGLQQWKVKGGTQQLSQFLKKEVEEKAGKNLRIRVKFHFEHIVTQIRQTDQSATIFAKSIAKPLSETQLSPNPISIQCTSIIYASSPACMNNITFSPPLSTQRRLLQKKSFMGDITKVVMLYPRPYWRQKGFSGQIVTDSLDSPIVSCYDDTKEYPTGQNGQMQIKQAAIIAFAGAAVYRDWRDRKTEDFNKAITDKMADLFKIEEMREPIAVRWEKFDDFATLGGGPVGVLPPGTLTHIKNLRKPEGRIHFAGTEMATVSIGYMDGAIESGIRAGKEVAEKVKNKNDPKQATEQVPVPKTKDPWYSKLIKSSKRWFEWW